MKKRVILLTFLVILVFFFFFNFKSFANSSLVINIDSNNDKIKIDYPRMEKSKSDFKTYSLIKENDELIAYHLTSYLNDLHIILYKHETEERFLMEAILFEKNTYTCLSEITTREYLYLSENDEKITNTSEEGKKLLNIQVLFDENHNYKKLDNCIENFAIQRNNRTLEEMTDTDAYLKSYYSEFDDSNLNYRKYNDKIINLIPEEYFYKEGIHAYIGKEYAFLIETISGYSTAQFVYCYINYVCIYDINTTFPLLKAEENSGLSDCEGIHLSSEIFLSIKPYLVRTYYAYDRNYVNSDSWLKNFDTTEQRVVVAKYNSEKNFYLAPKTFGIGIKESSDFSDNEKLIINRIDYEMKIKNSSLSPNFKTPFKNLVFDIISVTASIVKYGSLIKFVNETVKTFAELLENNYDAFQDMNNVNNSLKVTKKFSNSSEIITTNSFFNHPSYDAIFSGKYMDYEHVYTIELDLDKTYSSRFYDLAIAQEFEFYDNRGIVVSVNNGRNYSKSIFREDLNSNLIRDINAIKRPYCNPIPYSLENTNFLYGDIAIPGKSQAILFQVYSSGNYNINFYPTESFVIASIYDRNGNLIQTMEGSESYVSDLIVKLEQGEVYFLYFRLLSNTATGSVNIKVTKWMSNTEITINENLKTYNMTHFNKYDTFYFELILSRGGVYTFLTSSSEDTTIRVYSENFGILLESFDPLADWNDENPNLNANCQFYSKGINRKIIVAIYVRNYCEVSFYILYKESL